MLKGYFGRMKNTFWNGIALALRPYLILGAIISAPVFMLSQFYMLRMAFDAVPSWMFVAICISYSILFLGLAQLHDLLKERRK